jgi:hypothetical protein
LIGNIDLYYVDACLQVSLGNGSHSFHIVMSLSIRALAFFLVLTSHLCNAAFDSELFHSLSLLT